MSRDEFTRADMDVGFYSDPKVVALARRLRDPVRTAAYAALYDATVRASWKAGRRITLEESLPAWWLDSSTDVLADLVAVRLLDADGRVPAHAWASWFQPAAERVADARVAGMVGGLMRSLGLSKEDATLEARRRLAKGDLAVAQVTPSPTEPTIPTGPTGPTEPTDEGSPHTPRAHAHARQPRRSKESQHSKRAASSTDRGADGPVDPSKMTNGHDAAFERHRQAAIAGIASRDIVGLAAERAMVDYGITDAMIEDFGNVAPGNPQ